MKKGVRKEEKTEGGGRHACRHPFGWVEYVSPFDFQRKEGCPCCGAWRLVESRKEKVA